MLEQARKRAVFFLALASLALLALELRYFQLQVVRPRPSADAAAYRTRSVQDGAPHGRIFDRRGGLLAHSRTVYRLRAWAPDYDYVEELANALQEVASLDPVETTRLMNLHHVDRDYLEPVLSPEIDDPRLVAELEALSRRWPYRVLRLEAVHRRSYIHADRFAPLLGFVDSEGVGQAGLEAMFAKFLQPATGSRIVGRDGRGRFMADPWSGETPALRGADVQTTLCPLIQDAAERLLEQVMTEFQPKFAEAVVVEPQTGEVLALAQRPAPPPGRPETTEELEQRRLLPAQTQYTPGSTLKPLMMALCLERGCVDPSMEFDCEHGSYYLGRRQLTDIRGGYGVLPLEGLLVHSSNIGMAKIAMRLLDGEPEPGDPQFAPILDYYRRWGFGAPVLGIPGEASGRLTPLKQFSRTYSLASMSYGHEIAATALQVAAAAAGLVNDGLRMPLRICADLPNLCDQSPRQLVSVETARLVRAMLQKVVEEGATRPLRPPGFSMGGKTGTAQKDKDRTKDCMSFFCFAPVEDPQVLCLVVVDEPKKGRYASEVAAPCASQLLAEALKFQAVAPDRPEELARLAMGEKP